MVKYMDGGVFTPQEFPADYGFSKSAAPTPNVGRVQAQRMGTGQESPARDPKPTSGKSQNPMQARKPLAKGGPALSAETYGIKGGATADASKGVDKAAQPTMTGGRIRRAVGGPVAVPPGVNPAAAPLTRQPTANAVPQGNPLARAQVSMPAADLAGLTGSAARAGASTAVNNLAALGRRAGRIGPQASMGPGILSSPVAAKPRGVAPTAIPSSAAGTQMAATGGRIRRANGGHLSASARNKMPSSEFALPGKGDGPKGKGAGSYPIPDRGHAIAAKGRVKQFGSPAEKATVRAKVHAKFPNIGKG